MLRYLLTIFLICAAINAQAATISVSCTPPTRNTDGSAITGTISYTFHWGTSASALTNTVNGSTCNTTLTVPDPAPGASTTYYVGAKAIVGGISSAMSAVVSAVKSTPAPTPNPPVLRVIEPIAYRLDAGSWNRVAFTVIGSVPLDTACQSAYSATVNGVTMHMIEKRSYATPIGSLPYQVWAKCS